MKMYRVYITVALHYELFAENEDDAKDKAERDVYKDIRYCLDEGTLCPEFEIVDITKWSNYESYH